MTEPSWLSITGDIASAISLMMTIVIAIAAGDVRRVLLRNARVPGATVRLRALSNELRQALKDWPKGEQEANAILSKMDSVLTNLIPKLPSSEKKKLKSTRSLIRKRSAFLSGWSSRSNDERFEKHFEIYNETQGVTEALAQLNEDYKKRF